MWIMKQLSKRKGEKLEETEISYELFEKSNKENG